MSLRTIVRVTGLGWVPRRPGFQTVVTAAATFLGVFGAYIGVVTYLGLERADTVAAEQYGVSSYTSAEKAGANKTLYWDMSNFYDGRVVRIVVLSPGSRGPLPPGVTRWRPGVTQVSPALDALLATPEGARLLRPRIPGRLTGLIGPAGLVSDTELRAYVFIHRPEGSPAQLQPQHPYRIDFANGRVVSSFGAVSAVTRPTSVLILMLALTAAVLPVLTLTATAVRVRSTQREARLASLWLVGCGLRELRFVEASRAAMVAAVGAGAGLTATLVYRFIDSVRSSQGIVYSGASSYPVLPVLLLALGSIAVAAGTTASATRWDPEEAFAAVTSQRRPRQVSPVWWRALAVNLCVLAALFGLGLTGQSVARFLLLLEYLALFTLLIIAAVLMPSLAARVCRRLPGMGVAKLLAGSRVTALAPSTARGLSAIAIFVMVAPTMQGLVVLTDGPATEHVSGVTRTQVVVGAPRAMGAAIRNVPGVLVVAKPTGSEGFGSCGPRYPCLFRVTTDGSSATTEKLRNAVGWNGSVGAYNDPSTSQLYGWSMPRTYEILRIALLAALLACELAVLVGLLDGVHSRVRANAALAAMGISKRTTALAYVLELFLPALVTAAVSLTMGVAIMFQFGGFAGQWLPLNVSELLAEAMVFLVIFLLVLASSLPMAFKSGRPEHLRVAP